MNERKKSLEIRSWMETMDYIPKLPPGSSRSPLTLDALESSYSSNPSLWEHLMTRVKPAKEVKHIRQNILLNRLKNHKSHAYHLNDGIGKKIALLTEIKSIQSKLKLANKEAEEYEKNIKKLATQLKVASSQRQYLKNKAENTEMKCIVIENSAEVNKAMAETFRQPTKSIRLYKVVKRKEFDFMVQNPNDIESNEELISNFPHLKREPYISKTTDENKIFLDSCISLARNMLDKALEVHNMKVASNACASLSTSLPTFNYSKFINFESETYLKVVLNADKSELKSFISENRMNFSASHLFKSLLSSFSEDLTKLQIYFDDNHPISNPRIPGRRQNDIEEMEVNISEKILEAHRNIIFDFMVAVQEKVASCKMKEELAVMMSSIENELNKKFEDVDMQRKVYKLIQTMVLERKLHGEISYINSITSDLNEEIWKVEQKNEVMELEKELKKTDEDMDHLKKVFKFLKIMSEEVEKDIKSNGSIVKSCLPKIDTEYFTRKIKDVESLAELPGEELRLFYKYPLECHRTTIFPMGREIDNSKLLMNCNNIGTIHFQNIATMDNFSKWVTLTLGMAPYSSTEHILAALLYSAVLGEYLVGFTQTSFYYKEEWSKMVSDILYTLEKDEEICRNIVTKTTNERVRSRLAVEKKADEVLSLISTWSEGKLNKCVPDKDRFDGKSFLEWYHDILTSM